MICGEPAPVSGRVCRRAAGHTTRHKAWGRTHAAEEWELADPDRARAAVRRLDDDRSWCRCGHPDHDHDPECRHRGCDCATFRLGAGGGQTELKVPIPKAGIAANNPGNVRLVLSRELIETNPVDPVTAHNAALERALLGRPAAPPQLCSRAGCGHAKRLHTLEDGACRVGSLLLVGGCGCPGWVE